MLRERKGALLSPITNWQLGRIFFFAQRYDQAIEQERKTLELGPNFWLVHTSLGLAYLQKSMHKEAIAEEEKAVALSSGNIVALEYLGYTYAVVGRKAEAQKVLDQLNELSKQSFVQSYYRATIYAGLGQRDKAFEWLEKSYQERSIASYMIQVTPVFDTLRSDPRFADLLRRMGLPQ